MNQLANVEKQLLTFDRRSCYLSKNSPGMVNLHGECNFHRLPIDGQEDSGHLAIGQLATSAFAGQADLACGDDNDRNSGSVSP